MNLAIRGIEQDLGAYAEDTSSVRRKKKHKTEKYRRQKIPSLFTEGIFGQAVIELFKHMGYTHVYDSDMNRDYTSPLLDAVLRDSLVRINKSTVPDAIDEAISRSKNFDFGSLLRKNN